MGKKLSRQDILDADDRKREVVEVPEWGGEVIVRGLSATDRDAFEASITVHRGKKSEVTTHNLRSKILVLCLVDEEDKPLFSIEDIQRLGLKSASAIERCFDVAQRLSGMRRDDVEVALKNSEADQSAVSISV